MEWTTPKVCALQQEAHRPVLLPSPLHPGQPVTSASLVLWEIRLSSSLGLCPKNLRGWSGHFQSHFLSTWEQAARWAMEPRPRGRFPPPHVRLSSVRHAALSPPMARAWLPLHHIVLPSTEDLFYHLLICLHPVPGKWAPRANGKMGKLRGNGETQTQLLLLQRWYGQALGFWFPPRPSTSQPLALWQGLQSSLVLSLSPKWGKNPSSP